MLDTAYDDVAVFLGDDFAIDVLIDGVSTRGIFDAAFERGGVGMVGIASTQPMLRLPAASVWSIAEDAVVVVGGTTYRFAEQEPDGTGWTMLFLERVR